MTIEIKMVFQEKEELLFKREVSSESFCKDYRELIIEAFNELTNKESLDGWIVKGRVRR